MAEETITNDVNGIDIVVSDDLTVDDENKSKLEILERENEENSEKIKLLMDEIEGLKTDRVETKKRLDARLDEKQKEIDESEADKRALQAISSRAADLETEVSRLQHDLISTETECEDLSKELRVVKSEVEDLKMREKEKEIKVESLEKEKADLIEQLEHEKAEKERQISELEKKLSSFEDVISVKESEILGLKEEKKEKEGENASNLAASETSDSRVGELQSEVALLQSKLDELTSKNTMNGAAVVGSETEREIKSTEKGLKGLKRYWPAAMATTGTVAVVAAVVYIGYSRKR